MRRRDLLAAIAGATLAGKGVPRAATARPRLGILNLTTREATAVDDAALRDALKGLGYVEGQTLDIDQRDADGDTTRLAGLVRELLQSNPDVILASAPVVAVAVQSVAPSVPIVCPIVTPSLIPRLAASYAHPGGSVTGFSNVVEGMWGKLVELTRDAIPGVSKIGLLVNPSSPDAEPSKQQIAAAAQSSGTEVAIAEAATTDELRAVLQHLAAEKIQALIVPANGLFISVQPLLVDLAMASHVPLIFANREGAAAGGLASYGVSAVENYRRSAGYIDKILKGAKPGDLPIEFPTKFELVVNLKTAKTLGLTIPPTLLARADDVIE